jgi:hypothetical protein
MHDEVSPMDEGIFALPARGGNMKNLLKVKTVD